MKLLYFASIRQKIGKAEETLAPPPEAVTVATLIEWLKTRGPAYAEALKNPKLVRVAVNREYVPADRRIAPGDEIGLFPPVTGG
ncbi:MAG TPA: molybdopterin converting factor subunit 1 [Stellaceae bacterium]|nr:molybdopterin converting factor subunit 1 [Stellaceae bacterium]